MFLINDVVTEAASSVKVQEEVQAESSVKVQEEVQALCGSVQDVSLSDTDKGVLKTVGDEGVLKTVGRLTDPETIYLAFSAWRKNIKRNNKEHLPSQVIYKDQVIKQFGGATIVEQIIFRNLGFVYISGEKQLLMFVITSYLPYYEDVTSDDKSLAQNYIEFAIQHYENNMHDELKYNACTSTCYMSGEEILKEKRMEQLIKY